VNTIKKAYAETSLGQIHFCHRPGIGTPIVFLHQTASSSVMYHEVMQGLSLDNPLYAFDTPGFGGSPEPAGDKPSMLDFADWLVEAINFCGIDNFHLLGHHTGVCIGAEIENKHPQRVKSLMMIGPVPLTQEERDAFREKTQGLPPTADGSYLQETWDYLLGLGADSDVRLHQRELADSIRAYSGRFLAYSAVWDQDFTKLYQQIKAPLLIMCAPDDILFDVFQRAKDLRPDALAMEIGGANFEPDQDPDGVIKAIEMFVGQHDN
jgi:pimeloyl-ACP methyl ester carboxylesterase